jgi:uncharacterized protein DUF6745
MWGLVESLLPWSENSARRRILAGRPPRRMRIHGRLDLAGRESIRELPRSLRATAVDLAGCVHLRELPKRLRCAALIARRTGIESLHSGLQVSGTIDAEECPRLRFVGPLALEQLSLRGCRLLKDLAEGLSVRRLIVSGCPRLTLLPRSLVTSVVDLDLSQCTGIVALPDNFARLQTLDISGCTQLTELPEGIRIRSRIEVAGSGVRSLPWSLKSVRITWRGVVVPDRVAFNPETITVDEVLRERNVTTRSILLDRMGVARFVQQSRAVVADRDNDAGGERRLLRIPFENGEDVVCLEVKCPSTGKQYFLRVPPYTKSCAYAAAWIAGFRNPIDYRPIVET